MIEAKLLIFYEDRIDILKEHTYIDREQDKEGITYKCTTIDSFWTDKKAIVVHCAEIGTHGLFVPGDNEYIPPHRIEKIKVDFGRFEIYE